MAQSQLTRINSWWFLTLGLTALAAGILVYILLLESALGAFSIQEATLASFSSSSRTRVALLESDYTKRNPQDPTSNVWVTETVDSWRVFLTDRNRNIPYNTITDADLERGNLHDAYDVLILPSSSAMSDRQMQAVKDFMQAGGSVLATWTPGIYYPDGTWRGWSFLEEVFGVSFEGFIERGAGNYRIYADTFPGTTPTGIYMPTRSLSSTFSATTTASASFAPLRGYTWVDTLNANPPQTDFATAQAVTVNMRDITGQRRVQEAVAVTYYTWVGGDPKAQIPYPYTGPGIQRFTLRGNTPLTANIPSGYRAKVQVYNQGIRMRILEPRTKPAGFWFDFATENRVVTEALENTTGVVYGNYGEGRFVYLGFQRDAMGVGPDDAEDWVQIGTFFSNMMNYLLRKPISWVHDWPNTPVGERDFTPHTAGAIFVGVGDDEIQNFASVADVLDRSGIDGTYLVRPAEVSPYGDLLSRLHRTGDVGVLDDLKDNQDGTVTDQGARLATLKSALEGIIGGTKPVTGYRSTQRGRLSNNTMGGLVDAEYQYFLPDSIGRRTVPKIMGSPYEVLTRIGVTARSDQELQNRLASTQGASDLWTGFFTDDIARVKYEGGLYNLTFSSDLLAGAEHIGVLESIAQTIRQENFWVRSGDELATWWRLHQSLRADVEQRGPSRVLVRVSNTNGATVENATVSIALNRRVPDTGSVRLRPELIDVPEFVKNGFNPNTDVPQYKLVENGSVIMLRIDELKPQQYRIFHIDILNEEGKPLLTDDE